MMRTSSRNTSFATATQGAVVEGASEGADVVLGLARAGAFPFDRAPQLEAVRTLGS